MTKPKKAPKQNRFSYQASPFTKEEIMKRGRICNASQFEPLKPLEPYRGQQTRSFVSMLGARK